MKTLFFSFNVKTELYVRKVYGIRKVVVERMNRNEMKVYFALFISILAYNNLFEKNVSI